MINATPVRITVGAHVGFHHRKLFAQRLIAAEINNVRDALYLKYECDYEECNFDLEMVWYLKALISAYILSRVQY
jgi:lactam utilization protein B